MPKYKVLLPTNGLAVGEVVELTDAEAQGYNAGEPTPRVEQVADDAPAVEKPAGENPEPAPEAPAPETTPTPAREDAGTDAGAGADAGTAAPEGGSEAEK